LSEPLVNQPLEISFDTKGRMWVVHYNQYPFPEGVKITGLDNHLRLQFDRVPEPPPAGLKGADKITIFEDTDGDGTFDKSTDGVTGLNIATSAVQGRGQIWVLNPPYLISYPDPDGDGVPDGDPVVHLSGFGLQDTHAVANSLRWGPDGWLYGAQGSTATSSVNSPARPSGAIIPRPKFSRSSPKEVAIRSTSNLIPRDGFIPGTTGMVAVHISNKAPTMKRPGGNTAP